MTTPNIFGEDNSQAKSTETPAAQGDSLPESVATLVGEGRKYKTVDELAKAYLHMDEFAEKLKSENATLRDEVSKAKTVDDVLKRLEAKPSASVQDPDDKKGSTAGLSVQDVAKIVSDTLSGLETQRSRNANLLKADAAMKAIFGDKAGEVFAKEASTPEMKKTLMDLASVSPEKFVALFAPAKSGGGSQVDSKTSVNTGALDTRSVSGREADPMCKEYYDALRRKDPRAYYSSAIQLQMNKAAVGNEKFFAP
jgi:hypothetical protein